MRAGGRRLLAFAAALLAGAVRAAEPPSDISLAFDDAELATIVESLGRATGQTIIFDDGLTGKITITAEDTVTASEALEMLNTALLVSGFAAVPAPSGSLKILPLKDAQGRAPWMPPEAARSSERLLVTMVRLEAADAGAIGRLLSSGPLQSGLVIAYPPTNSLILATSELQLRRLLEIIRALDYGTSTRLLVMPLRWANAGTVSQQLTDYVTDGAGTATVSVLADERTNSLIVQGTPERLARVRRFVRALDVPAPAAGGLHVVKIHNADAEVLAPELSAVAAADGGSLAAQDFDVIADAPTNSLIIRAQPEAFRELADLIVELDQLPRRVSLDVQIFEISTAHRLAVGLSWILPLTNANEIGDTLAVAGYGRISPLGVLPPDSQFSVGVAKQPLLIPIIDADGNPATLLVPQGEAQLEAEKGDAYLRMMMNPHLLAMSGEEHRIFAGENIPVPVSSVAAPGADPFTLTANIERQDIGVDVVVTPKARSADEVDLDLRVEVDSVASSALVGTSGGEDGEITGQVGPILQQMSMETSVRLSNGAVLLVAAAPREVVSYAEASVPILGSLPILGHFFSTTLETARLSQLVIAVQAIVIETPEEQQANSDLRRLAFKRQLGRVAPLENPMLAPYALLAATRRERAAAEAIADELRPRGPVEIVEWSYDGELHYDVYRTGFFEVTQAGTEAIALRALGLQPKLTHVSQFEEGF